MSAATYLESGENAKSTTHQLSKEFKTQICTADPQDPRGGLLSRGFRMRGIDRQAIRHLRNPVRVVSKPAA